MQTIMDDYHYAQQKGKIEPSYAYLRKEVEDHLGILKTRKIQKSQNAAAAAAAAGRQALVVSKGKGKIRARARARVKPRE